MLPISCMQKMGLWSDMFSDFVLFFVLFFLLFFFFTASHLRLGDEILAVNGYPLQGLAHAQAVQKLRGAGPAVILRVKPNQTLEGGTINRPCLPGQCVILILPPLSLPFPLLSLSLPPHQISSQLRVATTNLHKHPLLHTIQVCLASCILVSTLAPCLCLPSLVPRPFIQSKTGCRKGLS